MDRSDFLAMAVVALTTTAAFGDTVELTSSRDTSIFRESPDHSAGGGNGILAGNNANSETATRRGMLAFDLGAIPAGSTIQSVSLRLYLAQTTSSPRTLTLHRLNAAWGEGSAWGSGSGGGGAPATGGDATWTHRQYSTLTWSMQGGDFDPAPSGSTLVGAEGASYTWSSPQMTADVAAWFADGTQNHGWIIRGVETGTRTAFRFDSRESAIAANRPALVVNFAPPPPPTGACCSGSACVVLTAAECVGQFRRFVGPSVACNAPGVLNQPCCQADFDQSGMSNIDDLFLYLNAWFLGLLTADINGINGVTIDDLFLFFNVWFTGC